MTNPLKIDWPLDPYGVTTAFKKGLLETVSKVRGDVGKREVLEETIRVGVKWARERIAEQERQRAAYVARVASEGVEARTGQKAAEGGSQRLSGDAGDAD